AIMHLGDHARDLGGHRSRVDRGNRANRLEIDAEAARLRCCRNDRNRDPGHHPATPATATHRCLLALLLGRDYPVEKQAERKQNYAPDPAVAALSGGRFGGRRQLMIRGSDRGGRLRAHLYLSVFFVQKWIFPRENNEAT